MNMVDPCKISGNRLMLIISIPHTEPGWNRVTKVAESERQSCLSLTYNQKQESMEWNEMLG